MPAKPPVPSVVKFACRGTFGTATWVNLFHARYFGATPLTADYNAMATAIGTRLNTDFYTQLSTGWALTGIDWVDLSSETSPQGTQAHAAAGDVAGATAGAGVACCVSWKIARRYRGGHPRTYFGGIVAANLATTKTFQPTFVTNMQNGALAFRTALNAVTFSAGAGQWRLVCVHYYRNNALLVSPIVDDLTGAAVGSRIDSMRRRLGA